MIDSATLLFVLLFGSFFLVWLFMVVWGGPQVHKKMCRDHHGSVKTFHRDFKKFSEDIVKYSDKFGVDEKYPNKIFLLFPRSGSMFSKTDYDNNFYIHADIVSINGEKYIAKYFWNYWRMVFILRKMYAEKLAKNDLCYRYSRGL